MKHLYNKIQNAQQAVFLFFFKDTYVLLNLILLLVLYPLFLTTQNSIADEIPHFGQIEALARAVNPFFVHFNSHITTLPFFHYFFAYILRISYVLHIYEVFFRVTGLALIYRATFDLISLRFLFYIITIIGLFAIRRYNKQSNFQIPNSIIVFILSCPIILPYTSLVYTDIFAMLFILFSIQTAFASRPHLSAFSIMCATAIRQPALVWSVISVAILCYQEIKMTSYFFTPGTNLKSRLYQLIYAMFKKVYLFIVLYILFGIYVFVHNSISFGDQSLHALTLNVSNIWFFGAVFFVCTIGFTYKLIPYSHIFQWGQNQRVALPHLSLFIWSFIFVVLYFIYNKTYYITHIFNRPEYGWYLHNRILNATTTEPIWHILFGIFSITGLLVFCFSRVYSKNPAVEYTFKTISLLSIGVMPLIEQRYYIPIFAIYFLLLSRSGALTRIYTRSLWFTNLQIIANVVFGSYLMYGIAHSHFFI